MTKRIVVASGKGGTGKTTITALFAQIASARYSVVVADTDVEASNLPLALQVHAEQQKEFSGALRPSIDLSLCDGCARCVDACCFDALTIDLSNGCARVDSWSCEGCFACERACPVHAISRSSTVAGVVCSGMALTGPLVYGQLVPGEDLSGKLVTAVRERAEQVAQEIDAEILLVDGPPGVGCPVIAALARVDMLVAVAEPTVSGVHDLSRLIDLAHRFKLDSTVIINKADLSDEGVKQLKIFAAHQNIPILGTVPFDRALGNALVDLGEKACTVNADVDSRGLEALRMIWKKLEERLEL